MAIDFDKGLKRVFRLTAKYTGKRAIQFYLESYSKQGKTDNGFQPWKKRKDAKNKKPILVDTRVMKKSFNLTTNNDKFSIQNTAPYAIYHNEGGSENLPKREFLYESKELNKEIEKTLVDEVNKLMSKMFK